jgi:L-phenylalanine/L-methionine N-acetyltransferase
MDAPAEQSPIVVRRARVGDAEAYAAMMSEPGVFPQLMQMPFADVEAWRRRLEPPAAEALDLRLVAEVGAQVVGSAGLHPAGWSPRRRHAMQLGISVMTAWHGRGVGSALMQALCAYADGWLGLRRLELDVYADNARAIALYKRFGFEVEGMHRGYALRDGQLADSLSMARIVPAPPMAGESGP